MQSPRRSFLFGLLTVVAIFVVVVTVFLAYVYLEERALVNADREARNAPFDAKQLALQPICDESVALINSLLRNDIDPIVAAYRDQRFAKSMISTELFENVDRARRLADECAIGKSYSRVASEQVPLAQSPLFAAAGALGRIADLLRTVRSTSCASDCEAALVARIVTMRAEIKTPVGIR